ncbi:MAG: glycosyltransferase family 2 protein [Magnetococcales bacterium]|nr:glycosyltransferase family 2 protein [Magnetococcales bacterium]
MSNTNQQSTSTPSVLSEPDKNKDNKHSGAPYISVVIPAYNEELNVRNTIQTCLKHLRKITPHFEILIINDASTDRTGEIADTMQNEYPDEVRVFHNPVNVNVGISLRAGISYSRGDIVMHNSMDLPFDMEDLTNILPLLDHYDLVVVSRIDRSGHTNWRRLMSFVNWLFLKLLFGIPFKDLNFIQIYRREVLTKISVRSTSPAFVTPEMVMEAKRLGFKIGETKSSFHRRQKGASSFGGIRGITWTLADMISYRFEKN